MLSPELLRTFQVLAQEKHFSRTARILHMTQPGVSQHLKRLEQHFGTSLFLRSGKYMSLTEAGRQLLAYAHAQTTAYEELARTLGRDDPHIGHSRFAAPGSFGLPLFDALLSAMKKYPSLRLELTVMPAPQVPLRVLHNEIDIGFTTEASQESRLEFHPFTQEELLLVVPKNFSGRSIQDLQTLGYVHHPDGPLLTDRLLSRNFSAYPGASHFPVRTSINQISRILDPVSRGLGFSVVPAFTLDRFPLRKKVKVLPLKHKIRDTLYCVTRKGEKTPSRIQTVEAELEKYLSGTRNHLLKKHQTL